MNSLYLSLARRIGARLTTAPCQNPNQGHDNELARSKLRPLVLEEVRQEVDVKLLEYLANIRAELEAAKKGKKKKGKEKKKKKKPKKDKAKKKKLSEGEKACVGMSLEDMMSALVRSKIAQRVSPHWRPLSDFKGDPNPLGALYDKAEIFADPSASQLRECVTSMAILPLGSEHVHRAAPLVNSLLLFGPAGSGKTMLSRAIALHANATLLDLSPKVLGCGLFSRARLPPRCLSPPAFRAVRCLAPSRRPPRSSTWPSRSPRRASRPSSTLTTSSSTLLRVSDARASRPCPWRAPRFRLRLTLARNAQERARRKAALAAPEAAVSKTIWRARGRCLPRKRPN